MFNNLVLVRWKGEIAKFCMGDGKIAKFLLDIGDFIKFL